jgi:hypothetical protein
VWPQLHGRAQPASSQHYLFARAAQERLGLFVLVPEFDVEAFPDAYSYNYGNVRRPPPKNALNGRDFWTFGIIDRLFAEVKAATRSNRKRFLMFGNSAGAQYVLRYLALTVRARLAAGGSQFRTIGPAKDPLRRRDIGSPFAPPFPLAGN